MDNVFVSYKTTQVREVIEAAATAMTHHNEMNEAKVFYSCYFERKILFLELDLCIM